MARPTTRSAAVRRVLHRAGGDRVWLRRSRSRATTTGLSIRLSKSKGILNGVGLAPFAISIILLSLVIDRIGTAGSWRGVHWA
jgi:hypothetical protein